MKITAQMTDPVLLHEFGERIARARVDRDLTQAALAEEAGVSKRTLERLESGEAATQLSSFLRICRALGLLERFEVLFPESTPSPMEQLKRKGQKRQRASGKPKPTPPKSWTWGEEQ